MDKKIYIQIFLFLLILVIITFVYLDYFKNSSDKNNIKN